MASGNKAEATSSVETLAPEVRARLVSFSVRARTVSRIVVLSPNKLQLTAHILPKLLNKRVHYKPSGGTRQLDLESSGFVQP